MPAVSELSRADAEDFQVQSAPHFARATTILLAGGLLPASLILEVSEEGGPAALSQLVQLAVRHKRG